VSREKGIQQQAKDDWDKALSVSSVASHSNAGGSQK